MSARSYDNGKAFEYACLTSLYQEISQHRACFVVGNKSYEEAGEVWTSLSEEEQNLFLLSAVAVVPKLFSLEPNILDDTGDTLTIELQQDREGQYGDVRDILITRPDRKWQVGLSAKHNNFAVKHSRLSGVLDFAENWFGGKCSQDYWDAVRPVFNQLLEYKKNNILFSEIQDKDTSVYLPVMEAFLAEMRRQLEVNPDVPKLLVEYLLGRFDFYKVISRDADRYTRLDSYNLHGTLNNSAGNVAPSIRIPRIRLPKRILYMGMKNGSCNTAEICMDEGWQFSFRIHNATTKAEPSLKFDIQIVGVPTTIVSINCTWR
ncbi:MAG: HaeIII family restriction endonuclease [Candidatus Cryptobacteroides sp.]